MLTGLSLRSVQVPKRHSRAPAAYGTGPRCWIRASPACVAVSLEVAPGLPPAILAKLGVFSGGMIAPRFTSTVTRNASRPRRDLPCGVESFIGEESHYDHGDNARPHGDIDAVNDQGHSEHDAKQMAEGNQEEDDPGDDGKGPFAHTA